MNSILLDPAWLAWYRAKHNERFVVTSGEEFEEYVTAVLALEYPDFIDPCPMGQRGDGGCDGLADSGRIFFACYGQRAQASQDDKTKAKLEHDFERALGAWDDFEEWQFITNASFGPGPSKALMGFQRDHEEGTERPIRLRTICKPDIFWNEHVSKLDQKALDTLFPGAPHAQAVELMDLINLLEVLGEMPCQDVGVADLRPVSDRKMEYNRLPIYSRYELNVGRLMSQRIDRWFGDQSDPELRDEKAARFKQIYLAAKSETSEPSEILYRIYVAIAGSDFAMSSKRANSAYALAAYFFDTCDIFERVPEEER